VPENIDTITVTDATRTTTLRVIGPVAGKPIAEFSAGLKVGPATYDERTQAFWLAMDDFSGGVGYRNIDIREETGLVWDNTGLDITRRGHMTLPPLQTSTALPTIPALYVYGTGWFPSNPIDRQSSTGDFFMGVGSAIFRSIDAGLNWTFVQDLNTAGYLMNQILAVREYGAGIFAFGRTATGYAYYYTVTPQTAGTWTVATLRPIYDAMVWDGKLYGRWEGGTSTTRGIVFFVTGAADWNINVASDAAYIWVPPAGPVQFVGAGTAPWGDPCFYVIAVGKMGALSLYAIDPGARKGVEVDVTGGVGIMDACVWNGNVVVTDGYTVWLYGMESQQIRNIGLPRKGGVPPCFSACQFLRMLGFGDYLYSLVLHHNALATTHPSSCQWWRYNGAGWSPYGKRMGALTGAENTGFHSVIVAALSPYAAIYRNATRLLLAVGAPATDVATGATHVYMPLPRYSDTPEYGQYDFFEASAGATALNTTSPWMDMGFHELDGALFWLKIDAINLSSDEKVMAEYQLDHDEAGAWVQMRDVTGAADTFDAATDTLYFKTTTSAKLGLQFRSVRFRFTLYRKAASTTETPEVIGFVLCYDKKPEHRTAWGIKLDINGMLERPANYQIGGLNFTVARLWAQLLDWWDTKPLLTLTIPNVTAPMYVRIADMPITIEDFRTAVKGKGFVDLQVLETIGA